MSNGFDIVGDQPSLTKNQRISQDEGLSRWHKLRDAIAITDGSPRITFLRLYIFSLIVSLLFGYFFRFRYNLALLEPDEKEYYDLASEILNGSWEISARRTIGFPLLIAGWRLLGLNLVGLQIMLTAINAFAPPLLYLLVRKLTRIPGVAIATGLCFAVWPSTLFYGTTLYSETAALPVFLLAVYLIPSGSRLTETPSHWRAALIAGIVLGITAHIRTMYQLYLPILLLVILFEERRIGMVLKRYSIVVAGFSLVVLPWSVYMTSRFDRTIILTANGGETLAGALTPKLIGPNAIFTTVGGDRTTWVGPGKWLPLHQNGYLSENELKKLPYDQLDNLLRERTIKWVSQNPGNALKLEGYKLAYMWGLYSSAPNSLSQTLFGSIPTVLLLLFSLACVLALPVQRVQLARLWTLALFVSGVALISWGSWRFRQPADAGLLAFSIICVGHIIASRRYGINSDAASEASTPNASAT